MQEGAQRSQKKPPSSRWTSYDDWDYNGTKEGLEAFIASINKSALVEHTEEFTRKSMCMSEPFSAGQFWCCFELVGADDTLLIARVRLPRYPDSNDRVDAKSEAYTIECEVATMQFLGEAVKGVPFPRLHAYEGPSSQRAADVGVTYLLIEGFSGNTLQDVQFDICALPLDQQERIITQWARIQAELASITFPTIRSISSFSKEAGATIGRLCSAMAEGFEDPGPFESSAAYFAAVGRARYLHGPFHFNHMDMGTQNILVDDDFTFLAVIDWEFAQSAPLEVDHYPMPFPLTSSDTKIEEILKDPDHVAHRNFSRQHATRQMYQREFLKAEQELERLGRPLKNSIASLLNGPASRVYGALEKIDVFPGQAKSLTYEIVRLAFGIEGEEATKYAEEMKTQMESQSASDREPWVFLRIYMLQFDVASAYQNACS